jgi:PAS domain S-box-containing protein
MKKSILIAIADIRLNNLIRKSIAKTGCKVISTRTGNDAIKLIQKRSIDLLLLDIKFLINDSQVKIRLDDIKLPYVIITGDDDEQKAVAFVKDGAMDYLLLNKGFLSLLPDRIDKLCRQISREQEYRSSLDVIEKGEKMNKSILETLMDPVYICSENHEILYSNPAMQKIIGNSFHDKKCYAAVFGSSGSCENCPSLNSQIFESITIPVEINVGTELRTFQASVSPIEYYDGSFSRLHILKDVSALIKARDLAANSEKRLKLVTDNAIDMVWQMDLRLKFTYLSPSAESILGYSMDEMIGRNLWDFARRREFVHMARHAMGAIMDYKNFSVITFETSLLHKNGKDIPVEITGKLLKDASGKAIGLQGSTKDISERIFAQYEQKKQHNLLRTLIDNIPDMIYVKDLSSRYVLNNTSHMRDLQVKNQADILQKTDYNFFDKETAGEFYRDEQKIINSGIPLINKEEFIPYGDGSNRWSLTTKVPIRDEKGGITGIAGINRDITQRKIIEDELFRSRYELALKNKIANVFLTAESDQLFQDVLKIILAEFKSAVGYFGYINEKQEMVCPSLHPDITKDCNVPDQSFTVPQSSWKGIWGKSLIEKKSLFANQGLQLPDGHIPTKNVLCVPIIIKDELLGQISIGNKPDDFNEKDQKLLESIALYIAPILLSYLNEEIMKGAKEEAFSQLKMAKEKAEESDKLKSAFLLNLSHELRTPLNAIIGFSNLLTTQNKEQDNSEFFAEQINTAGNDLMKMIEDTIAMSQLESGQIELDPVNKEIGKTLAELQVKFLNKYQKSFPEIEFHLEDKTLGLLIDTDHEILKNALSNILDNAAKFSGKGKVELGGYTLNGKQLLLYVKDSGIGIPEEHKDTVFEKFRKIENDKTLYRGNGLGLSISKGLVEIIGGSIQLESVPGEGTCVSISLPLT